MDYSMNTKAELIAMLQARDAEPIDIQVLAQKIERMTEKKVELSRRSNEVLTLGGVLSSEEKNLLSDALQNRAAKIQDKITELTALHAKLTTS